MVKLSDLNQHGLNEWELPSSYTPHMNTSITIFGDIDIIKSALKDESIPQAINAASLPGVVGNIVVMPDVHQGYGFPIGGVAATSYPEGIISPGAIGYDINCGIRLLSTKIELSDSSTSLDKLAENLYQKCPAGMGAGCVFPTNQQQIKSICEIGSNWAVDHDMGNETDITRTEENGCLSGAAFRNLSEKAINRGKQQLGSLGSGNHFIEVGYVDEVFDKIASEEMGLEKGCLTVLIHCGSRGLGHQVCTDYVQDYQKIYQKEKYYLPDRELVYSGITTPLGQAYLSAMKCAANFGFTNRQVLAHQVRRSFAEVFGLKNREAQLRMVYDLAHNIGKIEKHTINGSYRKVLVHRKGATRAFGPGSDGLPEQYKSIGQPVLIPGSMGTASWVLTGTAKTMERSFGSLCHGAGRVMSRKEAKHSINPQGMREQISSQGIILKYRSMSGLVEEAPQAYKDVDMVIDVVTGAGLARKVAKLLPLIVIKG